MIMSRQHRRGCEPVGKPKRRRCAIYTRKSSEEGLEQSFNSLDAQRDACEAYCVSQKHEGWVVLDQPYDDGGLSGGSLHRPALQELLADIKAGSIDIVVVYKVDRLTRSLADFAKLTELFDDHGTSFVSVTQQFNTSTSMGRLTLNVLLSFAQFEREVAGERIRDKIAMSKRRGMWMGGLPPLGYDGVDGKLVVNDQEEQTIRLIFNTYLEQSSVAVLKSFLDARGVVSKRRKFKDGKEVGGGSISRGALYQILRNRLYRGEIAHRGEIHQGDHRAIIDEELWDKVQAKLATQAAKARGGNPDAGAGLSPALLKGLAYDDQGNRLTPSHAVNHGRRYRYYVSAPLTRGHSCRDGLRIPAGELETAVTSAVLAHLSDAVWIVDTLAVATDASTTSKLIAAAGQLSRQIANPQEHAHNIGAASLRDLIQRVVISHQDITISLEIHNLLAAIQDIDASIRPGAPLSNPLKIRLAALTLRTGKEVRLVIGDIDETDLAIDHEMISLIRRARCWFEDLKTGRAASIAAIARRDNVHIPEVSRSISLAFLAPEMVEMILSGRQPRQLTVERLRACRPLPFDWQQQRDLLLG